MKSENEVFGHDKKVDYIQESQHPVKRIECVVEGMTCSSCEVILERRLGRVNGVHTVSVDRADERLVVECDENVSIDTLSNAIKGKGYTLHELDSQHNLLKKGGKFFSMPSGKWEEVGAALLVLLSIYVIVTSFDLLPKGIGVKDGMSFGFIFLIGLVAATSTCLAVAGGLLLAVAQKYNDANPGVSGWQKFKPHISFNVGRIIGYTLLGGAIGALGSVLTISPTVSGMITIIASLLMIVMGLQLLGIFPWMSNIQLKMPKFIAHRIYGVGENKNNSGGVVSSFFFGGATFFLPCGFTQALQLYVLGSGSFLAGALTMLAFSLGTLPSLAGIGLFTSFVKKGNVQKYFMTFSAILVIILGIYNFAPGLTMVGVDVSSLDFGGSGSEAVAGTIEEGESGEVQVIEVEVRGLDYYPNSFTVKQGVPVEFLVDGSGAVGCAQIFAIPDMGINQRLSRGVDTITFTPQKTGKMIFSCGMGMAGPGVIEVI
ncbi:hypothetical protein HOC01_01640 [archaeon]|jgi:uncharacterized protein|nr:hypothetical protein [archaeon]MBT6697978.1 hypothetical protein [archaeon]